MTNPAQTHNTTSRAWYRLHVFVLTSGFSRAWRQLDVSRSVLITCFSRVSPRLQDSHIQYYLFFLRLTSVACFPRSVLITSFSRAWPRLHVSCAQYWLLVFPAFCKPALSNISSLLQCLGYWWLDIFPRLRPVQVVYFSALLIAWLWW